MDSALMLLLVAGIAGFGGGGIAGGASAGSLVGYTPDPEKPPRRWPWCRYCPPLFGAILAVIIWMAVRDEVEPAVAVLASTMVGFTAGAAGGIVSDMVGGVMR